MPMLPALPGLQPAGAAPFVDNTVLAKSAVVRDAEAAGAGEAVGVVPGVVLELDAFLAEDDGDADPDQQDDAGDERGLQPDARGARLGITGRDDRHGRHEGLLAG